MLKGLQEGDTTTHSSIFILGHFSNALEIQADPTHALWSLEIGNQVSTESPDREMKPQRKGVVIYSHIALYFCC